ncbi:MAG: radical SAM protein [Candidatus Alcyoniella australis]|nr:radical SAM protein [Candidatus Alcyoniella australis]
MKILLLAPRSSYWKSLFFFCEPMGLTYIASAARQAGHDVRLIQQLTTSDPSDDQIVRQVEEYQPDVIGLSVLSDSYAISLELVRRIRRVSRALIVYGGKHASINPEIAGDPGVAAVLVGEGEYAFCEILERYDGSIESIRDVQGLAYFDGELHSNGISARIENLDELPFPMRETLPMDRYRMVNLFGVPASLQRMASCVSSRGCVYNCLFCPTPMLSNRKWHARSVENVTAEIAQILDQYNSNFILFHDEDLLLDRKRAAALCEAMIDQGFQRRLKWGCETNISNIDDSLLELLAKSGCIFLSFGIESGDSETLEQMHKKVDLERAKETLVRVRKHKIQTNGNIIIGFPWEDRERIERSFATIKQMQLDTLAINVLVPIKRSELFEIAVNERLFVDRNYHNWTQKQAVMNTRHLSAAQVDELYRLLNRRFYFRPRFILRLLSSGVRKPINFLGMAEILVRSIWTRFRQF